MKISFYSRRVVNTELKDELLGSAWIEDGVIRAQPPELLEWLKGQRGTQRNPLNFGDGEAFLKALPRAFHNAYMYAVDEDQRSGGANPGGAERT